MITNEQWQQIENQLSLYLGCVTFQLNGYEISARRQQINETTLKIVVYINGEIKGSWGNKEKVDISEPSVIPLVWRDVKYLRSPFFTATKTLIRQYKKIEGLELVKIGV